MNKVLQISWWWYGISEGLTWWLLCLVVTAAALPLVLRVFRGLADRGSGLATGAGIALVTFHSWLLSLEWLGGDARALLPRAVLLLACFCLTGLASWRVWKSDRPWTPVERVRLYWPAVLFGLLGIFYIPHTAFGVWVSILLLSATSVVSWLGDGDRFRRTLRQIWAPLLVSQVLFLLGFCFFLNVRSYIPYATFEPGLSGAEKFGNFMHLNSMMRSTSMPPADAWFLGEPTNYYYAGHLTVATLAKAAGKPARYAFNFGLATVFGLTLSMGFSFCYNLVNLFARRIRLRTPPSGEGKSGGVFWPTGVGWGILGAFAIAFFGNLDAWQQLATRPVGSVQDDLVAELRERISDESMEGGLQGKTAEEFRAWQRSRFTQPRGVVADRWPPYLFSEDFVAKLPESLQSSLRGNESRYVSLKLEPPAEPDSDRLPIVEFEQMLIGQPPDILEDYQENERPRFLGRLRALDLAAYSRENIAQFSLEKIQANPLGVRFNPRNLAKIDFWRSSRAFKSSPPGNTNSGTITEFPYFSAILGDLHPHHMAIPYSLLILGACLSLLRKTSRMVSGGAVWFRRGWVDLLAMGVAIGMVFPVNIWDAVVMSPLLLLSILVSMRHVSFGWGWRWVGFAGMLVLLTFLTALIWNASKATPLLFGSPGLWLFAVVFSVAGVWAGRFRIPRTPPTLLAIGGLVLALIATFVGGMLSAASFSISGSAEEPLSPNIFLFGLRDVAVFAFAFGVSAFWALPLTSPDKRWWSAAGTAYLICGVTAILTILPFKLFFESPIESRDPVMVSLLPPVVSDSLMESAGTRFWGTFWKMSPVNPFPENLRTDLRDWFVHWGLFLIPILIFTVVRAVRHTARLKNGRGFLLWMGLTGILAFSFTYLGKWTGPVSLAVLTVCLVLAFGRHRREDAPVWVFLAVAFFFHWFVEALHFDDQYSGYLERYNTPFKIGYPLWAIMAGGMVYSLCALSRFLGSKGDQGKEGESAVALLLRPALAAMALFLVVLVPLFIEMMRWGWIGMVIWFVALFFWLQFGLLFSFLTTGRWDRRMFSSYLTTLAGHARRLPAFLLAGVIFLLGMLYPYAATATRTRSFFSTPVPHYAVNKPEEKLHTTRTLDALHHLSHIAGGKYEDDAAAIDWLLKNAPRDARILEAPGEHAYSSDGRIAGATGLPTLVGWSHHELQWRGWGRPVPLDLITRFAPYFTIDQLRLRDVINNSALFPERPDAETVRKLKRLMVSPPSMTSGLALRLFPEAEEPFAQKLSTAVQKSRREDPISYSELKDKLQAHGEIIYTAPSFGELVSEFPSSQNDASIPGTVADLIGFYGIDFVIVGSHEREKYGPGSVDPKLADQERRETIEARRRGLRKFEQWETVFEQGETAIYKVPESVQGEPGVDE